ncbi:tetratricopeptide repeat protein [Paenisporosarcina sp. TG20]|uniref:tetratricopeptide repeat protein n=1 Tax=Paenisporosarcina sp. TG20 TaxID=1211706 RepID=UPI001ED8C46A|nr:tetratricopeptide repeat protein [Paenisporosarcina sp. TG20]
MTNYNVDQEKALADLGRHIPTYHLIDVWKYLKETFDEIAPSPKEELPINPIHSRVPLKDIKNIHNWEKGFDEGYSYYENGDKARKEGNVDEAIELFDKARYNGYNVPTLYNSYAMAYRKLKDYDNEIAILDEAIERLQAEEKNVYETLIMNLNERRSKAFALKRR